MAAVLNAGAAPPISPAEYIIQVASGYMLSTALHVAARPRRCAGSCSTWSMSSRERFPGSKPRARGSLLDGKPHAKVILLESVIRPGNEPDTNADEYGELFRKTGFELLRIVPTHSPLSVIEARVA
jgi:hypothetical protein